MLHEVSRSDLLGGTVRRTVLSSGLRILTEVLPGVRSAAVGVWVGVGSRDESVPEAGASHYLEHLLFKGTPRRSALDISASLEAVGGELNAFTSHEYTCYYARVLDADLPLAVDVLSDMVLESLILDEDVDAERGVVLEEIAMHDDDPGDAVHDVFAAALLGSGPLGRPILGTVDSIEDMPRDRLNDYYRLRYAAPATVVAVSGAIDHDEVVRGVLDAFARAGDVPDADPAPARLGPRKPYPGGRTTVATRQTEQAHVVLGTAGLPRTDPRRHALTLLSTALGEGMSSRLFQEIREKRGLAYSVYSFTSSFADTGMIGVYAGCAPKRVDEVLGLCRAELAAAAESGLTDDELARAKGQNRGSLVLGLEDPLSRMSRLAKAELVYGELPPVEELLARYDRVTADEVRAVAAEILGGPLVLGAVGPFDEVLLEAS
ncbi:MAG TPA: pitrilysin family protein [Frankiaceae bacterium]|nr:pitrilysin family protein [Frankiaceae bacterium]